MEISWKRNFLILWAAQLIAIVGFQAIQPFLPYYIQTFEVANLEEALIWAGYLGTAGGLAMAVFSPIWGALADRFGRKAMVVRAMLGGAGAVILMAYVSSLGQLLAVRVLQGMLAGTVAACITLVATTTPRQHLGYALGMMQGAVMLGVSLGPLIGGPFIERFGYQTCFVGAGVLVLLGGVAVKLWVKEDFHRTEEERGEALDRGAFLKDAARLLRHKPYLVMLVSASLIQFTLAMLMPVLPLFLQRMANTENIESLAGLVFSLMGLVGAISSVVIGKWSDRIGPRRALIGGLLASAVLVAAQGLSTSVTMLATLRILNGLAIGAIGPVASAIIARLVPEGDRGKAFGLLTSANAAGFALGPMIGAYLGAEWGFRSVFFVTAGLLLLVSAWVWNAMRRIELEETGKLQLRHLLRIRERLASRFRR